MSRLSAVLSKLSANACIETGTQDGWQYRKYADGHIEAWKDISIPSTAGTQWGSNPYYYQDYDISIPSGWLTAMSKTAVQVTSGNTQWWVFGNWFTSLTNVRVRLTKFVSSSQAAAVKVFIKGM